MSCTYLLPKGYATMNHSFNKILILLNLACGSFMIPLVGNATETQVTKAIDSKGNFRGVVVRTPQVLFYVTVYGNLAKFAPNTPALLEAQHFAQALGKKPVPIKALKIEYYPQSQFDGNGGKVAQVNGIRINYYPCMANNETLTGVQNDSNTQRGLSGSFPVTYNKGFKFACRSLDGNGGKVRSIGSVHFTYYPNDRMSYNGGKLSRAGNYTITYHSPNSFTGQAGELQSFGN